MDGNGNAFCSRPPPPSSQSLAELLLCRVSVNPANGGELRAALRGQASDEGARRSGKSTNAAPREPPQRRMVDPPRIEGTNLKLAHDAQYRVQPDKYDAENWRCAGLAQMEAVAATSGECERSCAVFRHRQPPPSRASNLAAGATLIHNIHDGRAFRALNLWSLPRLFGHRAGQLAA
uniref:Uncharacterized protein n=1 Tax=Mycena chlorophos TaxID=658473 RepID=A0ABQ0LH26_MYCCL|nr:predicted protein [Mycena chlorophos]